MELAYTSNIYSIMLDQYLEPTITGNLINDNLKLLQSDDNIVRIKVSDKYKFRPELVARQYYGHESFYPLILAANNIGSLLHFIPSEFNNEIKMIKSNVIEKLFNI